MNLCTVVERVSNRQIRGLDRDTGTPAPNGRPQRRSLRFPLSLRRGIGRRVRRTAAAAAQGGAIPRSCGCV